MIGRKKEKKNVIEFYPWTEEVEAVVTGPVPAVKNVPEFWKKMPKFHGADEIKVGNRNHPGTNLSLKHCMVYLDALTSGYHYVTWCDIVVKNVRGIPQLTWRPDTIEPLFVRDPDHYPTPMGHYNAHFSWNMHWGLKTPPGWSCIITHPLNREDLPFTTTSGIMDTDTLTNPGNVSFHIKEDFEGIIPKGTPYMQVIPVKREEWESVVNKDLVKYGHHDMEKKKTMLYGFYKKTRWIPKSYK
jgi:hypothetical protein